MKQSSDEGMSEVFAECLDMLRSGASPAACYERFPEHASELEGLFGALMRVEALRPVPPRHPAVVEARRNVFLRDAYALHVSHNRQVAANTTAPRNSWLVALTTRLSSLIAVLARPKSVAFSIISYLLLIAFTGILGMGAVSASAAALPGDLLYPVKRAGESVQVFFARDPERRAELQETFQGRRADEIRSVLERRRTATVPLAGTIEQIDANTWLVSGLPVTLTADTIIEGRPEVGAQVDGRARAPGDGSLVALRVEIVAPPAAPATATGTALPPTAAATLRPTASLRPTATDEPPATNTPVREASIQLPPVPIIEPAEATITPEPPPTATPTATRTRTPARRPSATPTSSPTPVSRGQQTGNVSGTVLAINDRLWLINEVWVETFGGTRYGGHPGFGKHVDVRYEIRAGQAPLALEIVEIGEPEIVEYDTTGVLVQMGEPWVVQIDPGNSVAFRVTKETKFENGEPGLGETITVRIRAEGGDRTALAITRVKGKATYWDGEIELMEPGHWIIGGRSIILGEGVSIQGGPPVIGAWARADGYESLDGQAIIATVITISQ